MNCRHCSNELHNNFIDLGAQPPSNSYLNEADLDQPETYLPLKAYVCDSCYLVQTADYADREVFFNSDYAYFSSTSSTWLDHAKQYSQKIIEEFGIDQNSFVMEVASNDGYLLRNFKEKHVPCLGVEPTESTASAALSLGVNTLVEFYSSELAKSVRNEYGGADVIACNNVYAHVPDINDFTAALEISLKDDGIVTIEFPHLLNLVEKCQFDTIYHEHYSYLSVFTVSKIFESKGLKLFRAESIPTHGGSVRVYGCKQGAHHEICPSVNKTIELERQGGLFDFSTFDNFNSRVHAIKLQLLEFLVAAKKNGKKVCGYGAAAKGNTLLNYAGIKDDFLPFVADSAPSKIGKYLPGSRIPVVAPSVLIDFRPDYVIIFPWNIASEIKSQLSGHNLDECRFVTFVPELREV